MQLTHILCWNMEIQSSLVMAKIATQQLTQSQSPDLRCKRRVVGVTENKLLTCRAVVITHKLQICGC